MDISDLLKWTENAADGLGFKEQAAAREILKEIRSRLKFLTAVGAALSVAQPCIVVAFGRRKPAHKTCHTDGFGTGKCALYT